MYLYAQVGYPRRDYLFKPQLEMIGYLTIILNKFM